MDIQAELMFDEITKTYEATFGHDPGLHRVSDEALKRIEPDSRIFDVGCSIGRLIAYRMAKAGHEVTGLDIS